MKACVVVPWHNAVQREAFASAWGLEEYAACSEVALRAAPDWVVFQQDASRSGCGMTKNRGVDEAVRRGADVVVVLDDDCFPTSEALTLGDLIDGHLKALQPQQVSLFQAVTDPPSRGTPYGAMTVTMPVAASMGFWTGVPDYCAARQLAFASQPMTFERRPVYGRYFPLCGMNLAFRPSAWQPWCTFIDVPRFDDIWMGWLWQREAYRRGYCFNLAGPLVHHARQSDAYRNLRTEAAYLDANEHLWQQIATHDREDYASLRALLPRHEGSAWSP